MFSRKRDPTAAAKGKAQGGSGLSLIGAELTVSGDLTSAGQVHVEGRVHGNVRCISLCQSASGVITGHIETGEARIGGLVEGNVAAGTVVIEASGRVTGDVAYDTISIAAGARVDGRLARRSVLAGGDSAAALVATPVDPEAGLEPGSLFSGQPTRIAVD